MERIKNKDYYLVVDHSSKYIALLGIQTNYEETDENQFKVDLKDLLGACEKVEFKNIDDEKSSYMLYFPDNISTYKKAKIIFNKQTYLIDKMTLYYNAPERMGTDEESPKQKPRLEIDCYNINTKPVFSANAFTYDKFLIKKTGKLYCKEHYKGYSFDNQLITK